MTQYRILNWYHTTPAGATVLAERFECMSSIFYVPTWVTRMIENSSWCAPINTEDSLRISKCAKYFI